MTTKTRDLGDGGGGTATTMPDPLAGFGPPKQPPGGNIGALYSPGPVSPEPVGLPRGTSAGTGYDAMQLQRVATLSRQQPWLPPQAQFALATAAMPDSQMFAVAEGLRQAVSKITDGFMGFHDDPVLHKQQSLGLAITKYINQTLGPVPVQDTDLSEIQKNLQREGFGRELKSNGAWSPAWNAAYRQWSDRLVRDQLAGKQPGGWTVGHALEAMGSVLPKAAGNALIGFAKSIPTAARQAVADLAQTVGATADLGNLGNPMGESQIGNTLGGLVEGQTAGEYKAGVDKAGLGRYVDDIGTVLLLHSMTKIGTNFARAAGSELFNSTAEMNAEAASRGPGVIAKTLGRGWAAEGAKGVLARGAMGGAVGALQGVVRGESGGEVARDFAIGAGAAGIVGTKAFAQIPVLGNTGPVLGKLFQEDGFYYKTRSLLATPYKLPAVRVAGDLVSKAGLAGAEVRGVAAVAGAANPDSPLAEGVQSEHVLDAVDDAVRHAQREVFGRDVSVGLDELVFFLHPPLDGATHLTRASDLVGNEVDGLVDGMEAALSNSGLAAQIEKGTGKLYPELVKEAGGKERFLRHWTYNILDHAAWHHAEKMMDSTDDLRGLEGLARAEQARAFHDEAWQDTALLKRALVEMTHGTDHTRNPFELPARIDRQITSAQVAGGSGEIGVGDRLSGHIDASDVMRTAVVPREMEIPQVAAAKRNFRLANPDAHWMTEPMVALGAKENLVQHEAIAQVNQFRAEAERLATEGATFDDIRNLEAKLGHFLFNEFNVNAQIMPHDLADRLDLAERFAGLLSEQVFLPHEAPAELVDAFKAINDKGYRVVVGTGGIGIRYRNLIPLDEVGEGATTLRRRVIEHVGLSPTRVPDVSVGAFRRSAIRRALQAGIDDGKIVMPPYWTPDTILALLQDKKAMTFEPGRVEGAMMSLFSTPRKKNIEELAAKIQESGVDTKEAKLLAQGLARDELARVLQLRDMKRSQVVELLTQPIEKVNKSWADQALAAGIDANDIDALKATPLFDKGSANMIYRSILSGSAAPKAYMLGATKVEDMIRSGLGFAGKKFPQSEFWNRISDLPNNLVRLRNEFRFRVSPYFSFRRITKTNAKLALEDVRPTLFPMEVMRKAGTVDKNLAELDRLFPHMADKGYDDATKFLYENDVFGFYTHRHYEAYAVGEWKKAGKSDEDVRKLVTKVFGYGARSGSGRSALERTTNFIFFPFSFDKTLYRNFGGYLLDRPGQMVLLTQGLKAYKAFNDAHENGDVPLAASWFEQHMPLLQEFERLNAFAHGISAGEFGGINRPLLNMFMPQHWDPSDPGFKEGIQRFAPLVKDFSRLYHESMDQAKILSTVAGNEIVDKITGDEPLPGLKPVAKSPEAQREEAYLAAQDTYEKYKDILYWNAHHSGDNRYKFPNNEKKLGNLAGEPITKTNILRLLKNKYPAISLTEPAKLADDKRAALQTYELSLHGQPHEREYKAFIDYATTAGRYIFDDRYSVDQARKETQRVRNFATVYSRRDPKFYDLYNRNFKYLFGPLERVK